MNFLTEIEVCRGPVAVKLGLQFVILAVHFNSLRITVNCAAEIFLPEVIIALVLVHFSYC